MFNPYEILRAGGVTRWHTAEELDPQTVAAHSWGVAILVMRFYPDYQPELLRAALLHDVAEYWIGDIPAQTKWRWPAIKKELKKAEQEIRIEKHIDYDLDPEEAAALKACDLLEWLIFRQRQARGRGHRSDTLDKNLQYILDEIARLGTPELVEYAFELNEQHQPQVRRIDPTGQKHPFGFNAEDEIKP